MNEEKFSKKLNNEAKIREEIIGEAFKSLEDMQLKQKEDESVLNQYRIEQIKYKTTIDELNEYVEVYKNKIKHLEEQNDKLEKEIMPLRKKVLKQDTDLSTLKSILELFIKEYGIDKIKELTSLETKKIESYIEGE